MGNNTATAAAATKAPKGKAAKAKPLTSGKAIAKGTKGKGTAPKGKGALAATKGKGKAGKGTTGRTFTLAPDDGRYNPYRFADDMKIVQTKAGADAYSAETGIGKWVAIALKAGTVGKFKAAITSNKADAKAKFPFDFLRIARRAGNLTVGGK